MSKSKLRLARLIAKVDTSEYELKSAGQTRLCHPFTSRRDQNQLKRAWTSFLHSKAQWDLMITLTFRRRSAKGFRVTQSSIEAAIKHLIRLINCDLFGKRQANKGWTLAHAATVDFGALGDHPHAHLLLEAPKGVSDEQLCAVVERAAQRTAIVDRQRHFRRYTDLGGAEYLIQHGIDRMVVPLLTSAQQG
jgi:hypothetical protein